MAGLHGCNMSGKWTSPFAFVGDDCFGNFAAYVEFIRKKEQSDGIGHGMVSITDYLTIMKQIAVDEKPEWMGAAEVHSASPLFAGDSVCDLAMRGLDYGALAIDPGCMIRVSDLSC